MKVSELLTDASKWTQGAVARNKDGAPCLANDPEAVAWSLDGAIVRCYVRDNYRLFSRKYSLVQRNFHADTAGWNDSGSRTYGHIMSVVDLYDL